MVGLFALTSLRLQFGGAYYPCVRCIVNELTCDLANTPLRYEYLDSNKMDFNDKSLIPEPKMKDNAQELAKALPEDVLIDPDKGEILCHIDNLVVIGIFSELWHRLAFAVSVIIDAISRPVHKEEAINR